MHKVSESHIGHLLHFKEYYCMTRKDTSANDAFFFFFQTVHIKAAHTTSQQEPNIQTTQVQTITTTQQAQVSDHAFHIIDYFHATFHT